MKQTRLFRFIYGLLLLATAHALSLGLMPVKSGAELVLTPEGQPRHVSDSPLLNNDNVKEGQDNRRAAFSLGSLKDLAVAPSSVLTSAFPVDLIVSYNDTSGNTKQFLARYASFSPILNVKLRSRFVILNCTACEPLLSKDLPETQGKIVIVQRGDCAFVDKVTNLLEANLDPHAIVIANNEPHRGLVTMYSTSFNDDDLVTVPILFMTFEDFVALKKVQSFDPELLVQTASLDGLVGVMLLMAISPTLLILVCYLIVKGLKHFRKRTLNARYKKIVQKLPVYIFSFNHLIPSINLQNYLRMTRQVADIPLIPSSCDDLSINQGELNLSNSYIINGTDIHSLSYLDLLYVDKDYFRTQKCSICLGHFVPLKSRVLVLKCKHVYHEECLSNWLVNFRRSCPLCNENLNLLEQNDVHFHEPRSSYNTFDPDLERGAPDFSRQFEYGGANPLGIEEHLQPRITSTTSLPLPVKSIEPTIKNPNSETCSPGLADSVQTTSSFVTTKSLLSHVMSSSFYTPQSTRDPNLEEFTLSNLSAETITLP